MADGYKFAPATPEQVSYIRKQLGTDEEDIKRAVEALRHWLSRQPHLPDNIDDSHIEKMYINCKCSVERVKRTLDGYFSLKKKMPVILLNRDPLGSDIMYTKQHIKMMMMPRLTKEAYRVHVITQLDPDPSTVRWPAYGKLMSIMAEVMYLDDYSLGDVLIYDLANLEMGHVLRTDINILHAMEVCYKTAYNRRLKALHLVNAKKAVEAVMNVIKMALSEKLVKRVHVHLPGTTTLFDYVQHDCVPDELGGTAGPVDDFAYEFLKRAEKMRNWFLEQDKYTSDESKRPPDNDYADSVYSTAGSFKKLVVD